MSTVVWATPADVGVFLGIPPANAGDDDWLVSCTDAANEVAFRRRQAAGYQDLAINPLDGRMVGDVIPNPDVQLGVVLYAGALYRERGATDGFASFVELGTFVPAGGTWAQVQRLWGVNRMAVG